MLVDALLSKQGPLAHVWLAANYDRKLSKHQLMSTNIVTTTAFIADSAAAPSLRRLLPSTATITLRLSGQLLLGIVRIYSRKTKYLLDDVNDIMHKLKQSFRYAVDGASGFAAGGRAAGSIALSGNSIAPAPVDLAQITLQDQATDFDLLFQEALTLDDPAEPTSSSPLNETFDFDRSIEVPRNAAWRAEADDEVDLDLDWGDTPIEAGRDARVAQPDLSELSMDFKDDMDFDLGEPLEAPPLEPELGATEAASADAEDTMPAPRPKRKLVGITAEGQLRTTKRRLVVDSVEAVETGVPIQQLREAQQRQLAPSITLHLTQEEKLQLIYELAQPRPKRCIGIDAELTNACDALAASAAATDSSPVHTGLPLPAESPAPLDLDFDLSLPELESESNEGDDVSTAAATAATVEVASHLRQTFTLGGATSLSSVIKNAAAQPQATSERSAATRCFFELLVLATNDCVSLAQNRSEVTISPRDKIWSSFL